MMILLTKSTFIPAAVLLAGIGLVAAHGPGGMRPPVRWRHISSARGELPTPPNSWREQTACLVFDVDHDGVDDVVIADRKAAPSVVWFRHTPKGRQRFLIDGSPVKVGAGGAFADIDEDGDVDISFGGRYDSNEIWWWENPYPNYDPARPWVRRTIKRSGATGQHDQVFGDFTGDGRVELAVWNQGANQLLLALPPADPRAGKEWTYSQIFTYEGKQRHEGLAKADINLDGRMDLAGGGHWFENRGGARFIAHLIDDSKRDSRAAVAQLKKGGWPEVVFSRGESVGRLDWYEWDGKTWLKHELFGSELSHVHTLEIADINKDGSNDVFAAEMGMWAPGDRGRNEHPKTLVFYGNGRGQFVTSLVSDSVANHESRLGDLNGDGLLDIVSKPFVWNAPRLDFWVQDSGKAVHSPLGLDRWERRIIGEKDARSMFVTSSDIDGDGAVDVVTGAWWYRNPGPSGDTWSRQQIGSPLRNMAAVYDFDNDGQPDILGTKGRGSEHNSELLWARNTGGGKFEILENVDEGCGAFIQGVAVARFDGGGPLQIVLSWHTPPGNAIQTLTVPGDPVKERWIIRDMFDFGKPTKQVDVGDIDRDGKLDILFVGNAASGDLKWLRNQGNGLWEPFTFFRRAGNRSHRVVLADMNRDGRLDAVVGHYRDDPGYLAWYEQPASPTQTWKEHVVATREQIHGPMSLSVADMDHDGDLDLVVGEHILKEMSEARLFVFENTEGRGEQWRQRLVWKGDEHHQGAHVTDIDGDGDLDILSIGWTHDHVLLYENKTVN